MGGCLYRERRPFEFQANYDLLIAEFELDHFCGFSGSSFELALHRGFLRVHRQNGVAAEHVCPLYFSICPYGDFHFYDAAEVQLFGEFGILRST